MRIKTITLRDLAEKLNYSETTISKALRNHPDLPSSTINKIKTLANDLSYVPNVFAQRLSSRKSNIIGLIVQQISSSYYSLLIDKMYDLAAINKYEITLFIAKNNAELEKNYMLKLMAMRADGIILLCQENFTNNKIADIIVNRCIPIVFITSNIFKKYNALILQDNRAIDKVIEHAVKLGYSKIAFIGESVKYQALNAFYRVLKKYNIEIKSHWIMLGEGNKDQGYQNVKILYKKKNLPELILVTNNDLAFGVYSAASDLGINIPSGIDVICYGYDNLQEYLSPPLSCVYYSTENISYLAFNLLLNNINNNITKPIQITVEPELKLRGTCISYKKNY